MDISGLLSFHISPLELFVRGSVMYWFLFLIFRFVLHRDAGSLGIADVLFVVLVADASQNAMGGEYTTIAEGMALVATLVGWNYLLDWASFKWAWARRVAEPAPLLLVDRGRIIGRNLRKELVTRDELDSQMRQAGVGGLAEVRAMFMESDGKFLVITFSGGNHSGSDQGIPGA